MSTKTPHRPTAATRNHDKRHPAPARNTANNRRRWYWLVGLVGITAIVGFGLLTSRPASSSDVHQAADFTLTNTSGQTIHLADYRGKNVLLYFSEGAGCQACLVQMREIERQQAQFSALNVTVLPIVMNSRDQILSDMRDNSVTTPFLLDDGTVSTAYGTIGKGMHSSLPGHSFVLVDTNGQQRWYGEYPNMWLDVPDLVSQIKSHLS